MIYFIGAGPGAADLITVRGRELLEKADIVIYAGSLVDPLQLEYCKEGVEIYNSAKMNLDEVLDIMIENEKKDKLIVRLHTGDPSIYGAIGEQMRELDRNDIYYEVVPGVSSFVAANAAVKAEMTLPDISQTIILTRIKGRTDVPEKENLASLAKHRASMAIFLSVQKIDEVVEELLEGYSIDTPAVIVYRASWEDERIIRGTLKNIASLAKENNIGRQAQILVGDFLDLHGSNFSLSKLYDKNFTTMYRKSVEEDR